MFVCMYMYVCMYVCMCVHVCVHVCGLCIHVLMYVCTYIVTYVHMCVCTLNKNTSGIKVQKQHYKYPGATKNFKAKKLIYQKYL